MIRTHEQFLKVSGFGLVFLCICLGLAFWFGSGYFCSCVVCCSCVRLVSSVLHQEIGWEERLRNKVLCQLGHKTLTQSINSHAAILNVILWSSGQNRQTLQQMSWQTRNCSMNNWNETQCTPSATKNVSSNDKDVDDNNGDDVDKQYYCCIASAAFWLCFSSSALLHQHKLYSWQLFLFSMITLYLKKTSHLWFAITLTYMNPFWYIWQKCYG